MSAHPGSESAQELPAPADRPAAGGRSPRRLPAPPWGLGRRSTHAAGPPAETAAPSASERAATAPVAARAGLWLAIGYVVITRLSIFLVGAAAIRLVLSADPSPVPAAVRVLPRSLRPWLSWDGTWYLSIVDGGYWFDPQGQSNIAFFPLFPTLIKGVSRGVGNPAVAALLVANVAAVVGAVLLWHWVRAEAGQAAAQDSVRWLMVYPFSFFLNAAYGESLYFVLAVGAFLALRQGRLAAAAGLAGLGAVTRPAGVLLIAALACAYWKALRTDSRPRARDWWALGLAPLGVAAFLAYQQVAFGDALAFWRAHVTGWDVSPLGNLRSYYADLRWVLTRSFPLQGYMQVLTTVRVVMPLVFVALTIQVFRRLGPVAGVYTALVVAVGTLFGLESAGREYLAAVPAFAVAGILTSGRQLEALRMLSMGILVVFLLAFLTGRFVG